MLYIAFLLACATGFSDPTRESGEPAPEATLYPVTVSSPTTLGVVDTPLADVRGVPIGVACVTCHGPDPDESWAARPGEPFHTGLELHHGAVTCASCHDPEDRTRLRLADGTQLSLLDAMDLCAQCHGPQTRDYRRGSHGGMSGYWDRRRGPRLRNNCVDCHDPHSPAWTKVTPRPPPADRRPMEDSHG